ncbi:phosphopantetheine-binding protein [Nocardiopsis halophila]|uniref:phosphopantetheine-binding protein n=1 Tax=Nocardiopsis halophila TaxID=141692 RepID=UPI000345F610|nr:phosphopantetheine-binding protein [Nocardiopsis halophila]
MTSPAEQTVHTGTAGGRAAEIRDLTVEWAARMLDAPDAEPEDNFVDLGGHSILALRMCRFAKERFGEEYDLMVLFESDLATAAADLAARVDAD